jgi:hypothetical protein
MPQKPNPYVHSGVWHWLFWYSWVENPLDIATSSSAIRSIEVSQFLNYKGSISDGRKDSYH